MRNNKWNYLNRHRLYLFLVDQFGPHSTWIKESAPSDDVAYENFLCSFAKEIEKENGNETTSEAVKQQIAWAITKQPRLWEEIQLRNYILNKAAALETGFIETKDLPHWAELESPSEL